MAEQQMQINQALELPPGFRFHPTDEEIVTFYLAPKVLDSRGFCATAIGEVDLNKCEPWDLPGKAKMIGEKEWYFYCQKDRKYPTGMRTNRATEAGYWKATGKDKEIFRRHHLLVGMKKTLVFYRGRAPKGDKTNWVMHEYRLAADSCTTTPHHDWAVCRIFHKSSGIKKPPLPADQLSLVVDDYSAAALHAQQQLMPPLMGMAPSSYSTLPLVPGYGSAGGVAAALPLPLPMSGHQQQFGVPQQQFYQQQQTVETMGGGGFMTEPASGPSSLLSQDTEQNNNNNNNAAAEISSAVACNINMAGMGDGCAIWKY